MRRQSSKARKIADTRREQRFMLLADRGSACEICKTEPWTDVHEILSRGRGGDPTDTTQQLCLCRACHHEVTTNPTWAEEHGYARSRTAEEHHAAYRPWTHTERN